MKADLAVGDRRDPTPPHILVCVACRSSWETKGHLTSDCHTVSSEPALSPPLYLQGPKVLPEAGGEGFRSQDPLLMMALAVGH